MKYLISEAEMEELKKHYKKKLDELQALGYRAGKAILRKYKNECIYDETKPIGTCDSCILMEVGEAVSNDNHGFTNALDVMNLLCRSEKHFGK